MLGAACAHPGVLLGKGCALGAGCVSHMGCAGIVDVFAYSSVGCAYMSWGVCVRVLMGSAVIVSLLRI